MPITVEEVLEDALGLNAEGRMLLAEKLLESIPPDKLIFDLQVGIAAQRGEEMASGAVKGVPGPEALRRVYEAIATRNGA